ncbi:MAG: antibiotic biosynthesis monooxygenase [Dehalococcoidia bacterium]
MTDEILDVVVLAEIKTKPDADQAEVDKALIEFIDWVRENEQGTLIYSAHRSKKDPTKIVFYEAYRRQDALDGHMQSSAFKEFGRKILNHIDPSATKIEQFQLIAGVTSVMERTADSPNMPEEVPPRD